MILSRIFICSLVFYQVLATEVDLEPWGEVTVSITKESPDTQTFTCSTQNEEDDQIGTFSWLLDSVEADTATQEVDAEIGFLSKFEYTPQLKDDNKQLTCQYNPQSGETGEASLTLKIQKHILPASPFILEPTKVGDPVKISLDMELYPLPENKNLVWVIEDSQQIEEKIELQPGQSDDSYKADELLSLEDNKYTATLTINALKQEDVQKKIYFLLKANEERKIEVEITMARDVDVPSDKRMGAGLWVIVVLVLVIILACIGYCVWQRWGRKRTTQEQDQEKGDFNQVPQTDAQK